MSKRIYIEFKYCEYCPHFHHDTFGCEYYCTEVGSEICRDTKPRFDVDPPDWCPLPRSENGHRVLDLHLTTCKECLYEEDNECTIAEGDDSKLHDSAVSIPDWCPLTYPMHHKWFHSMLIEIGDSNE